MKRYEISRRIGVARLNRGYDGFVLVRHVSEIDIVRIIDC